MGARAALVKGGHLAGERSRMLWWMKIGRSPVLRFPDRSSSTHGTGCTLASAIAMGLAQGSSLQDAIERARAFVRKAIRTGLPFGRGTARSIICIGLGSNFPSPREEGDKENE